MKSIFYPIIFQSKKLNVAVIIFVFETALQGF